MKQHRFLLPSFIRRSLVFCAVVSGLLSGSVLAANTWDGGGTTGNWSDSLNWDNNTVPANAQLLTFTGTQQLSMVNDTAITQANGLTFTETAGAFSLSGSALTMAGTITNNSAFTQTVNLALSYASDRTIQGGSSVSLLGGITNTRTTFLTLTNNLTGGLLTIGNINLSNTATSYGLTLVSHGDTLLSGVIANGGTATSGGFTRSGRGVVTLANANTYSGATTLNGGETVLDFSHASAPISNILYNGVGSPGNLQITQGSATTTGATVFRLIGADEEANTQAIGGFTFGSSGIRGVAAHLDLAAGTNGSVAISFAGTFQGYQGATLDISKAATDTVTLSSGANSSGGTVSVNLGLSTLVTLNGTDWAALDGSKNIVAATYSTSLATNNVNLDLASSGNLTATSLNTVRFHQASSDTLTVNTANTTINGILVTEQVGANTVTIAGSSIRGTNNQQLAVFQNNTAGDLIISSEIANQGTSALVKAGDGRLILAGSNSYTGRTFVNEGTLLVDGSISTGAVNVGIGATLGGTGSVGGATTVSGGYLLGGDGGTASGALTLSSNLTLIEGSTIVLTLGSGGSHSSLVRGGGDWVFGSNQAFTFNLVSAAAGTYDNIISGIVDDGGAWFDNLIAGIGTWTITNPGFEGTFFYDGTGGIDLAVTVVPEPASALLVLLGSAGLLLRRKLPRRAGV